MKLFILFLILSIFLQTTLISLHLCAIFIISRSLVVEDRKNYYLAFIAGIFLSLLSIKNLAFYPLIFLIFVKIIHLIHRLPVASSLLMIIPIFASSLLLIMLLEWVVFGVSLDFIKFFWELVLSVPVYAFVKFWEERFVVKPHIRLKI